MPCQVSFDCRSPVRWLTSGLFTSIDHSFALVISAPEICHWRSVSIDRPFTELTITLFNNSTCSVEWAGDRLTPHVIIEGLRTVYAPAHPIESHSTVGQSAGKDIVSIDPVISSHQTLGHPVALTKSLLQTLFAKPYSERFAISTASDS